MSVEILFLSVVLRKSSIERLDPDTQEAVEALFTWESDWFREDEHLIATSFMAPMDVRAFGTALEQRTSLMRQRDWAVVDMATGLTAPCHWLDFRGGVGKPCGAWLEGTEPGEHARVRSMAPGEQSAFPTRRGVMKLFGRDSNHDAEGHREDFGWFLPDWGGKDLWLFEVPACVDANGEDQPSRYASIEPACDFATLGRKQPTMKPLRPDHPVLSEGPRLMGVRRQR